MNNLEKIQKTMKVFQTLTKIVMGFSFVAIRQGERDVPVLRRKPQRPLGGQTDSVTEPTAEPHGTSGGREKPCSFRRLRPAICTV